MKTSSGILNEKIQTLITKAKAEPIVLSQRSEQELAEQIIGLFHNHVGPPRAVSGIFYTYLKETGEYVPIQKKELKSILHKFSVKYMKRVSGGTRATNWILNQPTIQNIYTTLLESREILVGDDFFDSPTPGINFRDGFLRLTGTGLFFDDHAPKFRARNGYNFAYSSSETTPVKWLEFLDSVFRDDADKENKITTLQEYIGCCIAGIAAVSGQKALLFIGSGSNGKSTTQELIRKVMPPGSVTSVPSRLFGDSNSRIRLNGSLLNMCDELPRRASNAEDIIKTAISGGHLTGHLKYRDSVEFRSLAGHIFGTNSWPETEDQTEGFRRRFIPITFNQTFSGAGGTYYRSEAQICREIEPEIPNIVSWAMTGAQRFIQNNRKFTALPNSKELMDEWMGAVNYVASWIKERQEVLPAESYPKNFRGIKAKWLREKWSPIADLHESYLTWCDELHIKDKLNRIRFGQKLSELGVGVQASGPISYRQLKLAQPAAMKLMSREFSQATN